MLFNPGIGDGRKGDDWVFCQDCVDLALLFIRTTIETQKLTVQLRGCGGPIDVAIIARGKTLKFIQQKVISGENSKHILYGK